jgi:methionine-rich copper-binding protein CopC
MRRGALVAVLVGWAVVAVGCAPTLDGRPKLVATWPADGASLPVAEQTLELTFNRPLDPNATWATVWRDGDTAPGSAGVASDPANARVLRVDLDGPAAGAYRLQWHAVAARSTAANDGEQRFYVRPESAPPPRLEVLRASAEAGDNVQVVGQGFGRECPVQLTIGDDDQDLAEVDTDSNGGFVATVRVPAVVPFGLQPVSAVDAHGDTATAALQVRWGGWPPLVAWTVGRAGPGPDEVTFWLHLRNRSDYVLERIRILMVDPEDAIFVAADPQASRHDGGVDWEIASADRGMVGQFSATYRVSGPAVSYAKIDFRHRRPRGCTGEECLPAFVSEINSKSVAVAPSQ